jgi:hypothetical protein
MRLDSLVGNQLLMAQAIFALAEHIEGATGAFMVPVAFAKLPTPPSTGMVSCVTDSTVNTWGSVIVGGGTFKVLGFYNGTNWTVLAK